MNKGKIAPLVIVSLLMLSGFAVFQASAGIGAPTLTPNFGPVGSKVKVSGEALETPSTTYPVRVYWSSDTTLNPAVDTLLATITAPKTGKSYETTITIPTIPPVIKDTDYYVFVWQDTDRDGVVDEGESAYTAFTVNYFSATVSPAIVKAGTYEFSITVKNDISTPAIYYVEITYPFEEGKITFANAIPPANWLLQEHDTENHILKFRATGGYEISTGASKVFKVSLSIASGATNGAKYWVVTCKNTAEQTSILTNPYLELFVDTVKPTVTITQPAENVFYSVGFGNRIWINGTVADTPPSSGVLSPTINDTRFTLISFVGGSFAFANTTAIPDGRLAVKVTAADKAGNVGSAERLTTVDNTAPRIVWVKVLDQEGNLLPYVGGIYWMGAYTTKIKVNAAFYNPAGITGKIYLNMTEYTFENKTDTSWFSVSGSDYVVLNITLVDGATPKPNRFTQMWEIKRDKVKPSAPTFTVQPICGGAVIRALTATDNVGVLSFKVYINGTPVDVPLTKLQAKILTSVDSHRTFEGVLVLSLAGYAGKTANITIKAVDCGANEGPGVSTLISVPKGTWHPVELYAGWNLVSLPLIPSSTATSDIYSLILKQGAAGVTVTYGFDNTAKSWVMNPTTMADGKGYWIHMKAYDVLIVQGLPTPEPPALPTTYHLPAGWCLAGFTETTNMAADKYLESLEPASYFRWLYVWDATSQSWIMVDTKPESAGTLCPGQAFWIYLYKDQDLIPPIPS